MDKCKDKIEAEAAKHKVEIYEGTGPAFEENVPKTIHQDRVLWFYQTSKRVIKITYNINILIIILYFHSFCPVVFLLQSESCEISLLLFLNATD